MRAGFLLLGAPLVLLACGTADRPTSLTDETSSLSVEARAALVTRALEGLAQHPELAQAGEGHSFDARGVILDSGGQAHVRLERSYRGLRVLGGDVVTHTASDGALTVSTTLTAPVTLSITPTLSPGDAVAVGTLSFVGLPTGESSAELVVYARSFPARLAYDALVMGVRDDQTPSELHVLVDALSGAVLDSWDAVETGKGGGNGGGSGGGGTPSTPVVGSGKTLYLGTMNMDTLKLGTGGYELRDQTRGNQYTLNLANRTSGGSTFTDADNVWGSSTVLDAATVGTDAHLGEAFTWDYYKNVHGRTGIANDGKGAYSRVHYSRNYVNAFWSDSCFCMTYGDGDGVSYSPLVSLDVAGHEMSHGVTSRTAGLLYSGESGGLNEATSDIFGTAVEFYAANANDLGDYLIGERIFINKPGVALRYMYDPAKDGASKGCWYSGIGSLDVHYSSGVANHLFYLLSEGSNPVNGQPISPTCDGSTVVGIGRAKAEKIWYRALTVYMTSNTNYAGARVATLKAATDLYGAGSAELGGVAAAWTAVSVN